MACSFQLPTSVFVLLIYAIHDTHSDIGIKPGIYLEARGVIKRVDMMAVMKRFRVNASALVIKSTKLALLKGQSPVVTVIGITHRSKGPDIVPGATNNAHLCTRGVGGVSGNNVDGAQKGVDAVSCRVWPSAYFYTLDELQWYRHGLPVHI